MAPGGFRRTWGFAGICAAPTAWLSAMPALAQGPATSALTGAAPLATARGAAAFALLSAIALHTVIGKGRAARRAAEDKIASLRALVDQYEGLLAAWPRIFGPSAFPVQSTVISRLAARP